MADAALQESVVPAALDFNSEPHGEHEVGDTDSAGHATDISESDTSADRHENDRDIPDTCPEISPNIQPGSKVTGTEMPNTKNPLSPTKSKPGLSLKPSQGKTPSAPPTPTIISSGTSSPATSAPPLKKSSSTPPAAAVSKPSASASRTSASIVPTRPAPSTGVKATSTTAPHGAVRASITSPTGSVASLKSSTTSHRPRPSISEAGKRATPTSTRPTPSTTKPAAGSTKQATPRTSTVGSAAKPSQPSASITSIHEVKEDGNDNEGMRKKLHDATEELASKAQAVNDLEDQIKRLQASLSDAKAEIEAKESSIGELRQERANMEASYKDQLEASGKQTTGAIVAQLTVAEDELMDPKISALQSAVQAKEESIQSLSLQRASLETQLSEITQKLESSRSSQKAAAEAEQLATSKMDADLNASIASIEALKSAHVQTNEELKSKLQDLERSASEIAQLETQITEMKAEREDHANKVSELEVEVLELKESHESLEDERDKLRAKVKELEDQISLLTAAAEQAQQDARAKEVEFSAKIEDLLSQHTRELQTSSEERAKIAANLEAVQSQLELAQRDLDVARKEAIAAAEAHSQELRKKSELHQEIERIKAELEGEEAKYSSQLEAFKAEHEVHLQDAFKRAKIEAGEQHALELQGLRESSNATIVQLRAANEANIEELKAEYSSTRESEITALEKQINTLSLELKAAKDDLAKAKASLDGARLEVESLSKQREDALAAAAAVPPVSSEHLEEKTRLINELSQAKHDLNSTTDLLDLTKASLSELSNSHAKELEGAAKARAEEVIKLRAEHDEETTTFANQKMELSMRISDLEGELATVKASIVERAPPRSNGVSVPHPPSPDTAGVTKEELQRMHEAHNLKLHDLQAEHDKAIKALQDEFKAAQQKAEELQQEVARKAMEIHYLEQDHEESQEQITRLKEDLEVIAQRPKLAEQSA
ncbi:hypothetical protein JOM56_006369 [Amanita muscaria]